MRPSDEVEIDLRYYYRLLVGQWWRLALSATLAALIMFGVSQLLTPIYQSTTTLLIDQRGNLALADLNTVRTSESLAATYAEMITSRNVLEPTIARLGLDYSPEKLRGKVTASPITGTQLLRIRVEDPNKELAAQIANTLADVLIEQVRAYQSSGYAASQQRLLTQLDYIEGQIAATEAAFQRLEGATGEADQAERARLANSLTEYNRNYSALLQSYEQIRLKELEASSNIQPTERAVAAQTQIRPRTLLNTAAALMLGLAGMTAFILVRDYLDDTIRNPEELSARYGIPIVGQIVRYDTEAERLITALRPRAPASEAYRALRMNIRYSSVDRPLHTLLITSAEPSEGKSTVASNLGVVLAAGGERVIVIDGDLRRPNLHKAFGLSNQVGTSTLFIDGLDNFGELLQPTEIPNLSVMTSGPIPPNPSELLDTRRAQEIVIVATKQADKVIVDAPPIAALTDSLALSQHVDGVLLVMRAGQTTRTAVRQAVERLRKVSANLIGFVVTDIDTRSARYGAYYYEYTANHYHTYFDEAEPSANGRQNGLIGALRRRMQPGTPK